MEKMMESVGATDPNTNDTSMDETATKCKCPECGYTGDESEFVENPDAEQASDETNGEPASKTRSFPDDKKTPGGMAIDIILANRKSKK